MTSEDVIKLKSVANEAIKSQSREQIENTIGLVLYLQSGYDSDLEQIKVALYKKYVALSKQKGVAK